MNANDLSLGLNAYFATPIVRGQFPDCEELNTSLRELFLSAEREPEKYRNRQPFNTTIGEVFDSEFDLFQWPQAPVRDLAGRMQQLVAGTVAQLNGYTQEQMRRLEFAYHAWFHVTRRGGAKTLHNHPNASWSAVYYVDAGDESDAKERSGYIQFYDPRAGAGMYQDPGNMHWSRPFSLNGLSIAPKTGQFLIFPSYLHHEVLSYWGERPRIVVAANAWFRSKS